MIYILCLMSRGVLTFVRESFIVVLRGFELHLSLIFFVNMLEHPSRILLLI